MKKLIFSTLAFCAFAVSTFAQTLTIPDVEVKPGDVAAFAFNVNVNNTDYKALSFTMNFPKTGFTLKGITVIPTWDPEDPNTGEGGQTGKGIGTLDENGQANGTFYNTNRVPMPYGDIKLGTISFEASKDLKAGDWYEVKLTKVQFATMDNAGVDISDVTFKIKVVSAYSVELDEESTVAPKAAEGVNVIVKRTIAANTWSTGCFPFAMDAAQIKTAFGDGVQLGEITGCKIEEDDDENVVAIAVGFKSISTIEANRPFIIKVNNPVSQFTVEGVNITPESAPELEAKDFGKKAGMYGTYVANTPVPEENLFLNDGKFWYSKGDNKMKAFRAYFELKETLAAYDAASRIYITFDDVTAIKNLKTNGEEEIYTLSGQRVDKAGKGVYIVNGKKVIKK